MLQANKIFTKSSFLSNRTRDVHKNRETETSISGKAILLQYIDDIRLLRRHKPDCKVSFSQIP